MYSFFEDFAGPVATMIAAGAASFITYRFSNAQRRATEMRLVLDLFDRRWEVIQGLRSAIAVMVTKGVIYGDPYWEYLSASQRAALLFGPEVTDYLETLRLAMVRHESQKDAVRSDDDAVRGRAADIQADAFTVISDFYKNFDPLITPYMKMHQKLPV
jgi:hypothetical protein